MPSSAAAYLEAQRRGYGDRFIAAFESAREFVIDHPRSGRPEPFDVRAWSIQGFSYSIVYTLEGDDVFIIAKVLLSKHADELNSPVRGFAPQALAAIKKYAWPGNIRQLENRIKKALVLCDRTLLGPEDLDLGPEAEQPIVPLEKAKEDFQRRYVLEVLERNNGNRTQTARDLGVDPRTIFRYLEREQNPIPSGAVGTTETE